MGTNTSIELIRGKYHATFKHGNQKFIVHTTSGTINDAKYTEEMLKKMFDRRPRCASEDITKVNDWNYCKCGATW